MAQKNENSLYKHGSGNASVTRAIRRRCRQQLCLQTSRMLGTLLNETGVRVGDVNDYLSSVTTTFPIQQRNEKSRCSLQQEDSTAWLQKYL
jgi:hypothetical protein